MFPCNKKKRKKNIKRVISVLRRNIKKTNHINSLFGPNEYSEYGKIYLNDLLCLCEKLSQEN